MSKRYLLSILTILFVFSACELAFEPAREYKLATSQTGAGEISVDPEQEVYEPGDTVQVSASPDSGWKFSQWLGDIERETNPTTVIMDSNIAIVAQFIEEAAEYTLDIAVEGEGAVAVDPEQTAYVEGTEVTLQADPAAGWSFQGWVGDFESQENPFTITMDSSITATAVFIRTSYILDTQTDGNGSIQRNPAQDLYEEGTEVQLIATPDAGWEFQYWFWNGDAMSSNDTTTITVTQDTTVRAVFQEATYFIFTTVNGQGSVSRNPAQEGYSYNAEVELTAIPEVGWTFDNWSGDLTGTQNPATIVMDSDKNITTNFFELPDGTYWEGYSKSQWTARSNHANESFNDKLYVFGGSNGSTFFNDVWTTTDGLNWDEETFNNPAPWGGRKNMATVVHDNALWIIGGNTADNSRENYGSVSDVWNTTDGSNWTQVADSTTSYPGMDSHAAVSFNGRIYITGGFNPSNESTNTVVYSSSDGVNWTTEGETPPRYGHASVVFKDKIWILGGNDGSGNYTNEIYSSSDGQTWNIVDPITEIWTAREDFTAVVFGGRIWVMGGNTSIGGYENDIWYSSDGVNWTQVTLNPNSPFWGPRAEHASAVFDNKVWVTGGINFDLIYLNDTWKTIKP